QPGRRVVARRRRKLVARVRTCGCRAPEDRPALGDVVGTRLVGRTRVVADARVVDGTSAAPTRARREPAAFVTGASRAVRLVTHAPDALLAAGRARPEVVGHRRTDDVGPRRSEDLVPR